MDSRLLSSPSSRFPFSLLGAAVCGGGWDLAAPDRGAPWKGACRNLPPREAQRLCPRWFLPGREAETGQAERRLFLLPSTGVVSGLGGSSRRFQEKCPAGLAPASGTLAPLQAGRLSPRAPRGLSCSEPPH